MPQKKQAPKKRGLSQEERRRKAANKPLGGGIPANRTDTASQGDRGYRSRTTRFQRITGIITVIMLVAIVLSLIPSCFAGVGASAATLHQEAPAVSQSYGSARYLQRETAVQAPTASLPRPTQDLPSDKLYVGSTGHYLSGAFLAFWNKQGGTTTLGDPVSEEFVQNGRTVQLFEKALLESHPEAADLKNQVQLGFLGRQLADVKGLHFDPATNTTSSATRTYFKETGQAISGNFKTFWEKNNGMLLLGLPIGPPVSEADNTVQYFERGVLQYQANSITLVEIAHSGEALITAMGWAQPVRVKTELDIDGDEIYQGRTLAVRLEPDSNWNIQNVTGQVGQETLKFVSVGAAFRTLKAFAPWDEPKTYPVNIFYTDPGGRNRELTIPIKVIKYDFGTQNLYLPDEKTYLTDKASDDYDNSQLADAYATFTPQILWKGFWTQPVYGEITTQFAEKRAYGDSTDYNLYHGGLDIAVPAGTPIPAPADGRVIYTGTLQARGNAVALDHGMGLTSYYYHLSKILVKPGDQLQKGQILGLVGTTGRSNGPHLHWEVRVNGTITYPMLFVKMDLSK
jgi:murein DD-endopeptidase MepM/ murein hydrolase activator NlpD